MAFQWFPGKRGDSLCAMQHVDTLARSHLSIAERGPGLVAADAESQKRKKYSSFGAKYFFVPIACEFLGVFGAETLSFLKAGRPLAIVCMKEPISKRKTVSVSCRILPNLTVTYCTLLPCFLHHQSYIPAHHAITFSIEKFLISQYLFVHDC